MVQNRILLSLMLGTAALLPGATISFTFTGTVNSSQVDRSLDSGANWTNGMSVGQMRMVVTSTSGFSGDVPTAFYTFCIEPLEGISAGNSYTYTIDPLSSAPTNINGGMGAIKANLLAELYGRYYNSFQNSTLTVVQASALQVATWEIVRETSGTYNVTTGTTRFRNATNSAVLTTANQMLASLTGDSSHFLTNLYSMRFSGSQDLAFHAERTIPEPATMALAALGVAAVALRRRIQHAAGRKPVSGAASAC